MSAITAVNSNVAKQTAIATVANGPEVRLHYHRCELDMACTGRANGGYGAPNGRGSRASP